MSQKHVCLKPVFYVEKNQCISIQKVVQMEITFVFLDSKTSITAQKLSWPCAFCGKPLYFIIPQSVFQISMFHLHVAAKCLFGYNPFDGIEYNYYVKVQ